MFKYGVNRWCFPVEVSLDKAISVSREAGYSGFEVVVNEEDVSMDKSKLKKKWVSVRDLADSLGVEIPSVATGLFWNYNWVLDKHVDKALKVLETEAFIASILGARVVLLVPGVAVPDLGYEEHYRCVARNLDRAGRIARDYGVVVGVENVWNKLFAGPLEFKKLLDMLDQSVFKAYFDIGNTLPHSLPEHWISVLGKRIVQVHVKDYSIVEKRFGIPLTGDINWRVVKERLIEIGYKGYIVAEIPPYRGDPYKAVYDTYTSLKKIFG